MDVARSTQQQLATLTSLVHKMAIQCNMVVNTKLKKLDIELSQLINEEAQLVAQRSHDPPLQPNEMSMEIIKIVMIKSDNMTVEPEEELEESRNLVAENIQNTNSICHDLQRSRERLCEHMESLQTPFPSFDTSI
ncbi:LOW QUALITY PROTEIN: hypothetical protein PanWU01x14_284970 [Parasponia andersonii]|uniref:Uncharacterized protein n=1 Tax=Parasponia andersonii TaxID=3476 RepID=A0A2P5AZR1_PARAD|nr:LOW QUALITY PROTEIN: hypothetical protein PanWU01x14_284970 [Parasponia andersonii]